MCAPTTAATRYRCLQQFLRWLVEDGEIATSPMANMRPPSVPEVPVPVVADDELHRLLAACEGKGFTERRDLALVRLFFDSGLRLAEMAGLRVEDLDLKERSVTVLAGTVAAGTVAADGPSWTAGGSASGPPPGSRRRSSSPRRHGSTPRRPG